MNVSFSLLSQEKLTMFEDSKKEEMMCDQQDGKCYRQLINRSPWMESEYL